MLIYLCFVCQAACIMENSFSFHYRTFFGEYWMLLIANSVRLYAVVYQCALINLVCKCFTMHYNSFCPVQSGYQCSATSYEDCTVHMKVQVMHVNVN